MGEIAEGLINGDFDFYTGEYLGRGIGFPRTKNRSLPWEKRRGIKTKNITNTKKAAYNGVVKYIEKKWIGRKERPSVREIIYEYTGEKNFDIKLRCISIQQEWGKFVIWVNNKIKESK
jgi:hypothetical protein